MTYILVGAMGIIIGGVVSACVEMSEENNFRTVRLFHAYMQHIEYVITEVFLAVVFVLMYMHFGFSTPFISYISLYIILSWVSLLDIQGRRIPGVLLAAGATVGFVLSFVNPEMTPVNAISGFIAAGATLWLVSFITGGGIGLDDVKVFSCTGMFLGFQPVLSALLVTAFLSGAAGLVMLAVHAKSRKDAMPITPYILICSIIVILFR